MITRLHRDGQMFIHQRIRELVRAFTERALRTRHRLELPPTPSTLSSEQGKSVNIILSVLVKILGDFKE